MIYDEIIIEEEFKDGHFIFTSPDVPGMLVVHKDRQVAWDDIPAVAKILLQDSP